MIMRHAIARAGRAALAVFFLAGVAAAAEPLTADKLPPRLLEACDAKAEPLEGVAPPIAAAARALINIGAFTAADFQGARIGFCDLQRAGGPVAAASCGDGVILLDAKYAAPDQALVLYATLAHEMTHHLQHLGRKSRYGAAYCESARYKADKTLLEEEADAFGDKIAALFVRGRAVEIVNACDDPVLIYLEAHDPVAIRGAQAALQRVPARTAALSLERALSGKVRFHAETRPVTGRARVWQDQSSAQTRFVEGRLIRPRETLLSAPERDSGPFRLRLECDGTPG